jgi:hypothetical protein
LEGGFFFFGDASAEHVTEYFIMRTVLPFPIVILIQSKEKECRT